MNNEKTLIDKADSVLKKLGVSLGVQSIDYAGRIAFNDVEHRLRSILKREGVDLSDWGYVLAFDAYISSDSDSLNLTVHYGSVLNDKIEKVEGIKIGLIEFFKLFERVNFIAANSHK